MGRDRRGRQSAGRRLRASSRDGGGVVNRPPSPLTMLLSRHTRRREVVAGVAAAAWQLEARGEQPPVPVVGFLSGRSQEDSAGDAAAFRQGLNEMGYVAGRNVVLEYRWAEGRNERLPELAADLVRQGVAVIAAVGGNNSALSARAATATIPIV